MQNGTEILLYFSIHDFVKMVENCFYHPPCHCTDLDPSCHCDEHLSLQEPPLGAAAVPDRCPTASAVSSHIVYGWMLKE